MKDNKKKIIEICKRMLFAPVWLMLLLVPVCTAALICIFVYGMDTHPVAYAAYVLSFYTLTVVCIKCVKVFPDWYRGVRQKVYDNSYGNRYMTDAGYRTHVSLYVSLAANLCYALLNVLSALTNRSSWFWILAVYYTILAVMRFLLVRFVRVRGLCEDILSEYRRARMCGIILLSVNLTLSGAVLMMLYQNRGYEYGGILIYVMAAYTFYITTHAIINVVRYRKYNSPVMSCAKYITLSAALVSMLSLETAMLTQFGASESETFRRIMIAATGAGVSIVVVAVSVYMIVSATKEIRKAKKSRTAP